jgi:hypothetical protein
MKVFWDRVLRKMFVCKEQKVAENGIMMIFMTGTAHQILLR